MFFRPLISLCLLSFTLLATPFQADVTNSLNALQQLRTVIPDRLWEEEFAIFVDTEGFRNAGAQPATHPRAHADQLPVAGVSASRYFFLHAAMIGEPIRLDDRYLEFLDSPYWKTPEALYRIYGLQHNYHKVPR